MEQMRLPLFLPTKHYETYEAIRVLSLLLGDATRYEVADLLNISTGKVCRYFVDLKKKYKVIFTSSQRFCTIEKTIKPIEAVKVVL